VSAVRPLGRPAPVVAIHQPNYAPWLGYFHKIARSDVFVFLDDAQFPKNGYTNRVQILARGAPRWLTVATKVSLGEPINAVRPAQPDWAQRHLDALRGSYTGAPAFKAVWPRVREIWSTAPDAGLAAINRHVVEAIASELGLRPRFAAASALGIAGKGGARLAAIVASLAPGGVYLSGKGGAQYQNEAEFTAASLSLRYSDFAQRPYKQDGGDFVPGLSILDAVFRLGWAGAGELVA
jgi:hypothetical protein